MKKKIIKKGNKYRSKYSLDTEDILTLIIAAAVLAFVLFQFVFRR